MDRYVPVATDIPHCFRASLTGVAWSAGIALSWETRPTLSVSELLLIVSFCCRRARISISVENYELVPHTCTVLRHQMTISG
jgi:hypothetical protein